MTADVGEYEFLQGAVAGFVRVRTETEKFGQIVQISLFCHESNLADQDADVPGGRLPPPHRLPSPSK